MDKKTEQRIWRLVDAAIGQIEQFKDLSKEEKELIRVAFGTGYLAGVEHGMKKGKK